MFDTMTRYLAGLPDAASRSVIRRVVEPSIARLSSQALTSAGLTINAAGATFAKIGPSAFFAVAGGKLVTIGANTALPALTGVAVPANWFGVVCFLTDASANMTMTAGNPAPMLAGATWPQLPIGMALIGAIVIAGPIPFIGGTTALDAGSNVYLNPMGAFDPTALV